jgi:tetratricopeptide (TPR) repeat protein
VAYDSLIPERRRALHARVVEVIERTYQDRLAEQFERLAHHALRGELPEKAVHYLWQAGGKALARSALAEARDFFEQGLVVLETLPESRSTLEQAFEIRLQLRVALRLLCEIPRLLERLREAETIARRLNDRGRLGHVCMMMANGHAVLGNLDEALTAGTRALAIAEATGDLKLRIDATDSLAQMHYFRGEYERVVALASHTLAVAPAHLMHDPLESSPVLTVFERCRLVMSLAQLGRFAEATRQEALAIRVTKPTQHAFTIGLVQWAAAILPLLRGAWMKARSPIERWFTVLRRGHVALHLPNALATSAWVLAQLGETREACNRLRESEQLLERQATEGILGYLGWAYHSLGRACLLLGRLDEAWTVGHRAVDYSSGQPGNAAHALHLLGDIAAHPDRFDIESGKAHYHKALTFAERRGMRPLVAHCHLGLGKLYRRAADDTKAEEHLTIAVSMYRGMDLGFWLQKVEAESGTS